MSTPFYDLASLVVVPSGYKSGKIYAQKPLTTDGQLTFTRASTATRVNASGLIETVSSNVPRLDYLGSTCPKLLLEPSRTNSAQYSQQADDPWWLKSLCTITANQGTAPDGTTTADLFTTGSPQAVIYRTGIAAGSLSFFVKAVSLNSGAKFYISVDGVGAAYWNQDGTLSSVAGGTATNAVSYGNGWYRCVYNVTSGSVLNYGLSAVTGSDRTCLIWGMQNEASASYPTSYIPTTTAAVTRVLDRAVKGSISSLIGQSAGTLFGEFVFDSSENVNRVFSITGADWNTNGSIRLDIIANKPEIYARKGGADIGSAGALPYTINKGATVKFAIVYTASSMKLFIAGNQIGSTVTLSTTPPTCSEFFINELGGGFSSASQNNQRTFWKQALLFTTALTDAQAKELTTL